MSNDENNKAIEKMKRLWKVFGKNIVTVGLLISAVITIQYLSRSMLSVAWSCILITSLCILILLVIILIYSYIAVPILDDYFLSNSNCIKDYNKAIDRYNEVKKTALGKLKDFSDLKDIENEFYSNYGEEIWIITCDMAQDSKDPLLMNIIEDNLQNGIKYFFFLTNSTIENKEKFIRHFNKYINVSLFIIEVDFVLLVPEIDITRYQFKNAEAQNYICVEVGEDEYKYINYPHNLDGNSYNRLKRLRDEYYKANLIENKKVKNNSVGKLKKIQNYVFYISIALELVTVSVMAAIGKLSHDWWIYLVFPLIGGVGSLFFSSILLSISEKYHIFF